MSDKKEKKPKITKDMVPEGFTLSLAIVDAIPVLLFAAAIVILGIKANFSPLIMLGGFIIFLAGAIKVLWKVIVATKQKNVFWMYKQMGPAMGVGFLLLIIGCIVSRAALKAAFAGIGVVSIVFFVLWLSCGSSACASWVSSRRSSTRRTRNPTGSNSVPTVLASSASASRWHCCK